MAEIKSGRQIAQKWAEVTPQRRDEYESGVDNPRRSWQNSTKQAESRYESGVQDAISNKRFGKGVDKVSDQEWQQKTKEKGASRWGSGVRVAERDFEEGFKPYRDTIESVDLPPRKSAGSPENIERVAAMANALHQRKVQG